MPSAYYKQVFFHTFPDLSPDGLPRGEWIALRPDGQLQIGDGPDAEIVDLGVAANNVLPTLLDASTPAVEVTTPNGIGSAGLHRLERNGRAEYWLHLQTVEHSRRVKLVWESGKNDQNTPPTLGIMPQGGYYVVNDDGVIRLYESATLADAGAFQAVYPGTANRVQRVVGAESAGLVGALTSWKNIVLYSLTERRLLLVRQIHDPVIVYEPGTARLLVTPDGGLVVAGGFGRTYNGGAEAVSVTAYRRVVNP